MRCTQEELESALFPAIDATNGIPSVKGLATALKPITGMGRGALGTFIGENPEIRKRMDERGRKWLKGLGEPEFLKAYSNLVWGNLPEETRTLLKARIDAMLLREIDRYDGVPDRAGLAGILGLNRGTIKMRVRDNPEIARRMVERGKAWLGSLDEEKFLEMCSGTWVGNLPKYAKEHVQKRFDRILLEKIRSSDTPTTISLGKTMGMHRNAIMCHIEANEELWFAYYGARGLSRDQAVELAIERGEKSGAIAGAIRARLRHLSASREIIGVMRCFGELMEKLVSCVSMYPEIVAVAAKEGGINMSAAHVPMNPFRRGDAQNIPSCGSVLVHGLHRLGGVGMNALFGKIRELYAEHPELSIITTHSTKYSITEAFLDAMGKNGFVFRESGSLKVESPDLETLESYGVAQEDLGRIKGKLTREFRVGLFSIAQLKEAVRIPELEKAIYSGGKSPIAKEYVGMEVPEGVGRELRARFFPNLEVDAHDPFVVEVVHGGSSCALIGFDMHPRRKRAVEVEVFPGAPVAEYRKIARLLATNMGFRRELGVKPERLSVLRLKECRQAMKAEK